jgi:hypothetical protein
MHKALYNFSHNSLQPYFKLHPSNLKLFLTGGTYLAQSTPAPVRRSWRKLFGLLVKVLFLLISIQIAWLFFDNLTTQPIVAKWGVIEKGCWVKALQLWQEAEIIAPSDGRLEITAVSSTRVPYGEALGAIYVADETGEKALPPARTITRQLGEALSQQSTLEYNASVLQKRLDALISEVEHVTALAGKNREDLLRLQQEKAVLLRNIQTNRTRITSLQQKLPRNKSLLLQAVYPGYFLAELDEEGRFLEPRRFQLLTEAEVRAPYAQRRPPRQVSAGTVVGRIVDPFTLRLALLIDDPELDIAVGYEVFILENDVRSISLVRGIRTLSPKRRLLLLDNPEPVLAFVPQRRVRVYMIYRRIIGVMIPQRAIYIMNGRSFVKLAKGDEHRVQEVQVLATDNGQAIVSGITFGTTIISR